MDYNEGLREFAACTLDYLFLLCERDDDEFDSLTNGVCLETLIDAVIVGVVAHGIRRAGIMLWAVLSTRRMRLRQELVAAMQRQGRFN
jgi:hypothetical protein